VVASATYLSAVGWLKKESLPTVTHKKDGFSDLIQFVELAYERINFKNEEMKLGFTTLLLGSLYEYCGHIPRRTEKSNRLIVDMMIYLNEHFREDLTLEELAHRFGYEKTYLSRTFNKYMGMNLREYLNRLRIDAVLKERAQYPDAPIYRIAQECGFDNQNTFYRAYNKYKSIE
jgi:AraC-like DNA-binding protein